MALARARSTSSSSLALAGIATEMPVSIHTSLKAKSFGRKKTTLGVLQRAAFGLTTFGTEIQY
jgi:hypothetical protein